MVMVWNVEAWLPHSLHAPTGYGAQRVPLQVRDPRWQASSMPAIGYVTTLYYPVLPDLTRQSTALFTRKGQGIPQTLYQIWFNKRHDPLSTVTLTLRLKRPIMMNLHWPPLGAHATSSPATCHTQHPAPGSARRRLAPAGGIRQRSFPTLAGRGKQG